MNWLKKLFPPNDWKTVWTDSTEWNVHTYDGKRTEYAIYEIFYSEFRNLYRLEITGSNPKAQMMYKYAIQKLVELRDKK